MQTQASRTLQEIAFGYEAARLNRSLIDDRLPAIDQPIAVRNPFCIASRCSATRPFPACLHLQIRSARSAVRSGLPILRAAIRIQLYR